MRIDLLESTIMEENHNPCLDLVVFVFKTMFEIKNRNDFQFCAKHIF